MTTNASTPLIAPAGLAGVSVTDTEIGDVRGEGFFFGIELVKDRATKETFDDEESERLLRGFLSKALWDAGLYCRTDDRGDPVIQLAPPLIASPAEFAEMEQILRSVLDKASGML